MPDLAVPQFAGPVMVPVGLVRLRLCLRFTCSRALGGEGGTPALPDTYLLFATFFSRDTIPA